MCIRDRSYISWSGEGILAPKGFKFCWTVVVALQKMNIRVPVSVPASDHDMNVEFVTHCELRSDIWFLRLLKYPADKRPTTKMATNAERYYKAVLKLTTSIERTGVSSPDLVPTDFCLNRQFKVEEWPLRMFKRLCKRSISSCKNRTYFSIRWIWQSPT